MTTIDDNDDNGDNDDNDDNADDDDNPGPPQFSPVLRFPRLQATYVFWFNLMCMFLFRTRHVCTSNHIHNSLLLKNCTYGTLIRTINPAHSTVKQGVLSSCSV